MPPPVEVIYDDCSVARLYTAAVRAASEMGYSITNSDTDAATVSWRTGMSWKSWQGQDMTATVFPEPPNGAKLIVGGRRATAGRQVQVYDWGEARSVARKFLAKLQDVIGTTPEPAPEARPSGSTADEIERLVELWRQGVLNDDEFDAAKRKLLA